MALVVAAVDVDVVAVVDVVDVDDDVVVAVVVVVEAVVMIVVGGAGQYPFESLGGPLVECLGKGLG